MIFTCGKIIKLAIFPHIKINQSCLLQILFRYETYLVENHQFVGLVGGVGAEDEDAFAFEEETVHIGDVHSAFGEDVYDVGGGTGLVVYLNCKYISELHVDVGGAENVVSLQRLSTNDAVDAKFLRVGNRGGNYLYAFLAQKVENLDQRSRLVLYEYR